LWPWVREAISELRPKYAILENVRGHLSLGGVSVIGELADIGYDAEWRVVSAASVGAHHRRDRVVIVAYPASQHSNGSNDYTGVGSRPKAFPQFGDSSGEKAMGDPNSKGWERCSELSEEIPKRSGLNQPGESAGWSGIWEPEPNVGRVAHGVSSRVDRLRGLGNAVVPQVAEVIGRLVVKHSCF
jgi:DNA (cytosine-5)-methyltransferase 1